MAEDGTPESKPQSAPLAPIAGKARDLEALRNAVVDAANVSAGLWFSYLFGLLYFVVAVGGVTHRNLLFESPVKLPFLNVDLPLVGFFVLGPAVFLIAHAYVLLHFAMLADKVGVFHVELRTQIADDDVRARLRRQLPSNIFVQFLAGPSEVRTGLMGVMLRVIALVTLVVGPLALLVFFQLQFLPYHHEAAAWWQRIAVVADLALIWALWPSIARGETSSIRWSDFRRTSVIVAGAASLLPILLVFTIATFPGEWLNKSPIRAPFIPQTKNGALVWVTPHHFLVAGDVDLIAGKPRSLWSNRIVLPYLDDLPKNYTLRGRSLEGAVLISANLPNIDFTAAQLQGAVLDNANLREAKFLCTFVSATLATDPTREEGATRGEERCAQLQDARFIGAQLQGATFYGANMRHAGLMNAQLQGAIFDFAELHESNFYKAQLQGASLELAKLRGAGLVDANLRVARMFRADLRGASLGGAQLQGAVLDEAEMQGAFLQFAELQGASLKRVHLQGANLKDTGLQAANFDSASLDGASLDGARLQGTSFSRANLDAASLQKVSIWRTELSRRNSTIRIHAPETVLLSAEASDCEAISFCSWSAANFATLKRLMLFHVPDGELRRKALERLQQLDPAASPSDEGENAKFWAESAASPPTEADYFKRVTEEFLKAGCEQDGAPYVIRAMLVTLHRRTLDSRFINGSPEVHEIANAFLDEEKCRGAAGLSEEDKAELRELRDSPPPNPSPSRGRRGPQPSPKQ